MEIHIIPADDDKEHDIDILCDCMPSLEYPNDDAVMVVHQAYDHRNHIEDLVEDLAVEMNYKGWEIWVET